MWNARKAQLDLELGDRHHLAKRSWPQSPSPSAARRLSNATGPRASKRERKAHSDGDAGREAILQRSGSRTQSSSNSEASPVGSSADGEAPNDGGALLSEEAAAEAERQLEELLSKSRVRGRGAVGPRADDPGPFLPASAAGVCIAVRHMVRSTSLAAKAASDLRRLSLTSNPVGCYHLLLALPTTR